MVQAIILMIVIGIAVAILLNRINLSDRPPTDWWNIKEKESGHSPKVNVGVEWHEDE